jgi:Uma2 family endonuclease
MEAIDYGHPAHRWTVQQFQRMIETGFFRSGDRVELIEGELLDMTPIGPPHSGSTGSLNMIFAGKLAGKAFVTSQTPLDLDSRTEVYPDLLVLKRRDDHYQRSNPGPEAVWLIVEVADSSLRYDLGAKLGLYARAGVPRLWVVDVKGRRIHDFFRPDRESGRYARETVVDRGGCSMEIEGVRVEVELSELFRI